MKTIGFANQYYTLWNVTKSIVAVNQIADAFYEVTNFEYIKNLSRDLGKAIDKAGTNNIDLNLKGTNTYQVRSEIKVDAKYFPYGKLAYTLISESEDIWQLKRLANEKKHILNAETAQKRLVELGFIFFEGEFKSEKEIENILAERQSNDNDKIEINSICQKGTIDFVADRNFSLTYNSDDEIEAEYSVLIGSTPIYFYLTSFKKMSYNGYDYALPLIDGKAKKIKGKNIRFHFEVTDNEKAIINKIEIS